MGPSLLFLNQVKRLTGGLALLEQVRFTQLPADTKPDGLMDAEVSLGASEENVTEIDFIHHKQLTSHQSSCADRIQQQTLVVLHETLRVSCVSAVLTSFPSFTGYLTEQMMLYPSCVSDRVMVSWILVVKVPSVFSSILL